MSRTREACRKELPHAVIEALSARVLPLLSEYRSCTELDLGHFEKASRVEMTREVVLIAVPASPICFCPERFYALIFPPCLAPCSSPAAGSDSGSWPADRDEWLAECGLSRRAPFRQLSSGAESRSLERASRRPPVTRSAGPAVCGRRPDRVGP